MEIDHGQLFKKDMEFIYEKEDLVTLRPGREHAWLDGLLERTLQILSCRLIRVSARSRPFKDKVLTSHDSSSSALRSVTSLRFTDLHLTKAHQ